MTSITEQIPGPAPASGSPLPELLNEAKELMVAALHSRLGEAGFGDIRPTHGCIFRFVPDQGMRLTEIATNAGITKQTCGEIVDDLEQLGYVERIPDPADRRAKLIRLTDRGAAAQSTARRLFAQIEAEWADRFGAERIALLREVLSEIAAPEAASAAA